MNNNQRNIANPFPRLALSCVLTIWAGANLWSCIFRWDEIMTQDIPSRTIGLFMAILFAVLPMVIAIYLFWTIVVGPENESQTPSQAFAQRAAKHSSGNSGKKKSKK